MNMPAPRRLLINIGANYAYLLLMMAITLVVVPIYVHTLGANAWGEVALCLTLQTAVFALDATLAAPMLRDIARAKIAQSLASTHARYARHYLNLALVAVLLIEGIGILLMRFTPEHPLAATRWPLHLVAFQVGCQIANQAAIGYWNGLERQHTSNARLALFALAKHGAALCIVMLWRADAIGFLLPFALLAALEVMSNRQRVRNELAAVAEPAGVVSSVDGLSTYAFAALLAIVSGQIDRIVLAAGLSNVEYGRYFLASTVLLSLMHLQMPLARAFMPKLATRQAGVQRQFRIAQLGLSVFALILALCADSVLRLWLHDAALATQLAPTLQGLMLAAAISMQIGPGYALLLNAGRHRQLAAIHATTLAVQLSVLLLTIAAAGMNAGVYAWLAAALLQLLWVTWATRDVARVQNP